MKISPATAIKAYIAPELSRQWFKKAGLEAPKWIPEV